MNNVGDTIKRFRELKNISRDQMASNLNMSLSGYSKIERNEVDLTLSKIEKISKVLDVEVSQVLNFDTSQIFNLNNTQLIQSVGAKAEQMYFHADDYKDKYIIMLEAEIERLKKTLEK